MLALRVRRNRRILLPIVPVVVPVVEPRMRPVITVPPFNRIEQGYLLDYDPHATVDVEYMEMMEKSMEDRLDGIEQDIDNCAGLGRDTNIMYQNYEVDGEMALNDLSALLRAKLRTVHIRRTVLQLHYEEPGWFASYPDDFTVHDGLFNLIPGYPDYQRLRHPPPKLRRAEEERLRGQSENIERMKTVLNAMRLEKEIEKRARDQEHRKRKHNSEPDSESEYEHKRKRRRRCDEESIGESDPSEEDTNGSENVRRSVRAGAHVDHLTYAKLGG